MLTREAYGGAYPAAAIATSDVQNAHRRAPTGISLRHSGHFVVVSSTGGSTLRPAISALTGRTTRKKTAAAIVTNAISLLMKSP
jgi:hypothetical protein